MKSKLPAIMFYIGDWMKASDIRMCSFAARGLWFDMLCLMHESDRRGFLQQPNGLPISQEQLCRMTGGSPDEVARLLQELDNSGVFSRSDKGIIYCRRMVRDEHKRQLLSAAGRKGGGNPLLKPVDKGRIKPLLEDEDVIEVENGIEGSPNGEGMQGEDGISADDIYAEYPRHIGKPVAITAILKAAKRLADGGRQNVADYLLERTMAYAKARRSLFDADPSAVKFTPHPSTWFNQSRFDDDEAEWCVESKTVGNNGARPNLAKPGQGFVPD
jgi:hypothetical protein